MKPEPNKPKESVREWIEQRYGPVRLQQHSVHFPGALAVVTSASVPVYRGAAVGVGASHEAAIAALKDDLTLL